MAPALEVERAPPSGAEGRKPVEGECRLGWALFSDRPSSVPSPKDWGNGVTCTSVSALLDEKRVERNRFSHFLVSRLPGALRCAWPGLQHGPPGVRRTGQ